jgi:alpha-L-rhamnosidase
MSALVHVSRSLMARARTAAAACVCLGAALATSPRPITAADRARVEVVSLTVDAMAEPLGIDDLHPRLAWRLQRAQRGVIQTGYRVLVASRPDRLSEGVADVWDSKDVAAPDPFALYAGPAVKSRTRYYWSVRVSTTGLGASAWSSPGWFETALLSTAEGQGSWIAGSVRGRVAVAWRQTPSGLQLDVTVPTTATAEVYVPASDRARVSESGRSADEADGVRFQRMVDGHAAYALGSGEYHFLSRKEVHP